MPFRRNNKKRDRRLAKVDFFTTLRASPSSQQDASDLSGSCNNLASPSGATLDTRLSRSCDELSDGASNIPTPSSRTPHEQQGATHGILPVLNPIRKEPEKRRLFFNARSKTPVPERPGAILEMTSRSGIRVFIFESDLTQQKCDVIVTPSDRKLRVTHGSAKAVAQAAGYDAMKKNCQDHIKQNGPVSVGQVVVMDGGHLNCRKVFLAVGPEWRGRGNASVCKALLSKTLRQCFQKAETYTYSSIALPPVSAGYQGVPITLVAMTLLEEVTSFCQQHTSRNAKLNSIFIVEKNKTNVLGIIKEFENKASGAVFRNLPGRLPGRLQSPISNRSKQPVNGRMNSATIAGSLPGFDGVGTILINYCFPSGIQTSEHYHPGKPYSSTRREAYLPDTAKGRKILALLRKAFDAGIIFSVGKSETSGCDDVIVWSGDISHKTSKTPGTYGYPDPNYLAKVQRELHAKGIM